MDPVFGAALVMGGAGLAVLCGVAFRALSRFLPPRPGEYVGQQLFPGPRVRGGGALGGAGDALRGAHVTEAGNGYLIEVVEDPFQPPAMYVAQDHEEAIEVLRRHMFKVIPHPGREVQ